MDPQQATMTPKQQTIEQLKASRSVVIGLAAQPSVDDYASGIGLAYILQKAGKKTSLVSTTPLPRQLSFLQPKDVLTTKLDHLRDFVIEIDKDKADKLRYVPEESSVKIFITPYSDEIKQSDLRFSQGDYNVDTVVTIGAVDKDKMDQVLKGHGKMLQESATVSLSAGSKLSNFGAINWQEPNASTVGEMLVSLADALQPGLLDKDVSQVLLSALIAATDRFHNHLTTPKVMTIAAQLMASGADTEVIMNQFEGTSTAKTADTKQDQQHSKSQGARNSLNIDHAKKNKANKKQNQRHAASHPEKAQTSQALQASTNAPEQPSREAQYSHQSAISPQVKPLHLDDRKSRPNEDESGPRDYPRQDLQPNQSQASSSASPTSQNWTPGSQTPAYNQQVSSQPQSFSDIPLLSHDSKYNTQQDKTPSDRNTGPHVNTHPNVPIWNQPRVDTPAPMTQNQQPVSQSAPPTQQTPGPYTPSSPPSYNTQAGTPPSVPLSNPEPLSQQPSASPDNTAQQQAMAETSVDEARQAVARAMEQTTPASEQSLVAGSAPVPQESTSANSDGSTDIYIAHDGSLQYPTTPKQ